MSHHVVYHVVPHHQHAGRLWKVEKEGEEHAIKIFLTKKDAVEHANELAEKNVPSHVIIHDVHGQIELERDHT